MKYSKVSSYVRPACRIPFNCFGTKIRFPRFGFICTRCIICLTFLFIGFISFLIGITDYLINIPSNILEVHFCIHIVRYYFNDKYSWIKYGYSEQINTHSAAFSMQGKRPAQEDRYVQNQISNYIIIYIHTVKPI